MDSGKMDGSFVNNKFRDEKNLNWKFIIGIKEW